MIQKNILQKFVYDGRYRAEHDSQQLQYGIVLYEFDHQVKRKESNSDN